MSDHQSRPAGLFSEYGLSPAGSPSLEGYRSAQKHMKARQLALARLDPVTQGLGEALQNFNTRNASQALAAGASIGDLEREAMPAILVWVASNAQRVEEALGLTELLLGKCDPNARDGEGATALMRAAQQQWPQLVALLATVIAPLARNDAGRSALMLACEVGADRCVEILMPLSDIQARDHEGRNALMIAACGAKFDALPGAGWLDALARASDLSARDHEGKTAMHHALEQSNVGAIARLARHFDLLAPGSGPSGASLARELTGIEGLGWLAPTNKAREALSAALAEQEARALGGDTAPALGPGKRMGL